MRLPASSVLFASLLGGTAALGDPVDLLAQPRSPATHVDSAAPCPSPGHDLSASADVAARAVRTLVRHGFANVAAVTDGRCVAVVFENARYRDERRALREAARLLLPELGGRDLVLVPTHRRVPLIAVRHAAPPPSGSAPAPDDPPDPAEITLDLSRVPPAVFDAPRASSSAGRAEVVVHPWFEATFGDFDNPVASRTGVAPELRVALWRGAAASAQVLVTLQDDVPTGESRVRPALLTLNQTVRLPRNVFVSGTVGAFTSNRYGVDVEGRAYLANGRVSVGAEAGMTGETAYRAGGWYRTPVRDRTALADAAWRVARYDLLLRATAGMFLERERGVRVDVVRQFGELEIGWFLLGSGDGANGGVTLRLPLLPAKRAGPAPVRLRAADAFRWQYRYRGIVPAGRRYDTGNSLEDFGRRLNPDYVRRGSDP